MVKTLVKFYPQSVSDTNPYPVTSSALYNSNRGPYRAFDGTATDWASKNVSGWLKINFLERKKLSKIYIKGNSLARYSPKNFTIQVSNDDVNWEIAATVTGATWANNETKTYDIELAEKGYQYLRINITANNGGLYSTITEIYFDELILTHRTLIFHDGYYKRWDETNGWTAVSATLPNAAQFLTDGMESTSPLIDRVNGVSPLDELQGNFEVITWNDQPDQPVVLELDAIPKPQLVYMDADVSIVGIDSIDKITLTATGDAKTAISFNNGLTWQAYRQDAWVGVQNASDGMTVSELNALTKEQINVIKGDSNFMRFGYYLPENAELDRMEVLVTLQGSEQLLPTDAYDLTYDEPNKTLVYNFKRDATVNINYVDA